MTSNVHKRLDKIKKEITDLGAKGRAFHFIVGDANETAEAGPAQSRGQHIYRG